MNGKLTSAPSALWAMADIWATVGKFSGYSGQLQAHSCVCHIVLFQQHPFVIE
jgi:hypothetical protein